MRWRAHCDWITTTWRGEAVVSEFGTVLALADWYTRIFAGTQPDARLERWAWQGYVGWSIGKLSIGERLDGCILRASGEAAQAYLESGYPIGHNVSRLDLCVDVWADNPPDTQIALHNVDALDYRMTVGHRPFKVAIVNGFGDGDTLYLGSRASETFVRIYNKEKESDGDERYAGCTRYEVEFKDKAAGQALDRGRVRYGHSRSILGAVQSVLMGRGINIPGDIDSPGLDTWTSARIATSDERKLEWLRTQVQPSVKSLLTRHDVGVILTALGLDET